jgi:hypothetical protein
MGMTDEDRRPKGSGTIERLAAKPVEAGRVAGKLHAVERGAPEASHVPPVEKASAKGRVYFVGRPQWRQCS